MSEVFIVFMFASLCVAPTLVAIASILKLNTLPRLASVKSISKRTPKLKAKLHLLLICGRYHYELMAIDSALGITPNLILVRQNKTKFMAVFSLHTFLT